MIPGKRTGAGKSRKKAKGKGGGGPLTINTRRYNSGYGSTGSGTNRWTYRPNRP